MVASANLNYILIDAFHWHFRFRVVRQSIFQSDIEFFIISEGPDESLVTYYPFVCGIGLINFTRVFPGLKFCLLITFVF
jgi:hypothetical protein